MSILIESKSVNFHQLTAHITPSNGQQKTHNLKFYVKIHRDTFRERLFNIQAVEFLVMSDVSACSSGDSYRRLLQPRLIVLIDFHPYARPAHAGEELHCMCKLQHLAHTPQTISKEIRSGAMITLRHIHHS